jgi:hypothetical protein
LNQWQLTKCATLNQWQLTKYATLNQWQLTKFATLNQWQLTKPDNPVLATENFKVDYHCPADVGM